MLYGKSVVLGVTGCIAAYKACEIVSRLKKLGANVDVIMTKNARKFVSPLTFETLAKSPVVIDTFKRTGEYDVHHVSLAKKADVFVVAPATANLIGKIAYGIADDMLTTTFLASNAPKLICPAMNPNMFNSAAVQDNIKTIESRGMTVMQPSVGVVACGDVGKGRLPEPEEIVEKICKILQPKQDFNGKTVLITAGGTEESIDGVRFITNRSSGKMGFALCDVAGSRGAEVVLIKGKTTAELPKNVAKTINVKTTQDMFDAVKENLERADIVVMAAAPADYKMKNVAPQKIKSETLTLELEKNPDIAKYVGENKGGKILAIFSAETENLIENATGKLKKKNADVVIANDVTKEGAGFDVDTNIATIITSSGEKFESGLVKKTELATLIFDVISELK